MSIFLQVFINGILFGTMYGIAAIGLSVIFGTMRIIFLAQGTMIVLFAYLVYWLHELLNIDPYLSALIVIPVSLPRRPRARSTCSSRRPRRSRTRTCLSCSRSGSCT